MNNNHNSSSSIKTVIDAIVDAGDEGITVKEITDRLCCTKIAVYSAVNKARQLKKRNKKHLYPGTIVSIDNKYYHKQNQHDSPINNVKPTTVANDDGVINQDKITIELLNELKTIPVEYVMTYLETREKAVIYEYTANILRTITSIFEKLRGEYEKKTN